MFSIAAGALSTGKVESHTVRTVVEAVNCGLRSRIHLEETYHSRDSQRRFCIRT